MAVSVQRFTLTRRSCRCPPPQLLPRARTPLFRPTPPHTRQIARGLLRQHFGFGEFKPGQEAVIGHLLAGRSAAAVFPTGGGKSLCYQLPALAPAGADARRLAADRLDERPDRRPHRAGYRRAAVGLDARPGRIPRGERRGPLRPAAAALRRPGTLRQRAVLRNDPADGDFACSPWTRPTASRNGATTSGPITCGWPASPSSAGQSGCWRSPPRPRRRC